MKYPTLTLYVNYFTHKSLRQYELQPVNFDPASFELRKWGQKTNWNRTFAL